MCKIEFGGASTKFRQFLRLMDQPAGQRCFQKFHSCHRCIVNHRQLAGNGNLDKTSGTFPTPSWISTQVSLVDNNIASSAAFFPIVVRKVGVHSDQIRPAARDPHLEECPLNIRKVCLGALIPYSRKAIKWQYALLCHVTAHVYYIKQNKNNHKSKSQKGVPLLDTIGGPWRNPLSK